MSLLISCFLGAGRRTIRKRQSDNFAEDPRVVRVQHEDPVFNPARAPTDGLRIWGGARQRLMMTLVYAIAFQCLLRFDEVVRIEVRHLRRHHLPEGPKIELTLDFRKTHQTGGKTSGIKYLLCDTNPNYRDQAIFILSKSNRAVA